ncbi:hypothetical protein MKQ70_28785 [Chitinophaga sedimenti]|uniref:hypothetical protein n=1 Tax=Chitinophaga sedimenti TaxID=2033606 RepID=UPI002003D363|nr:hypothetical protein [Chitinophaga sedimenti]MCK7558766.1 hypothetical protein [Chitinophaga sedimenti]
MQKLMWITGMAILLAACQNQPKPAESSETATTNTPNTAGVPVFSADSAYAYVAKQVSFGPRIPGTPAQKFVPTGWNKLYVRLQIPCMYNA